YQGLTNSTIADNKIIDALGNGNNIFIWGAAEAYNSTQNADYTNTVIEHNDICGSHRSGIEIAGGVDNLIITENHIYDNASINGGTSSTDLKYGNGILLIRMGSDKASPTARGPQNMIISNNIIEDNEKHGLYIGPFNKDLTITGNSFLNNGMSGIITDLTEAYHGGANPQYDVTSNVAAHENIISGNTNFGANVEGTPTNGFQLQAQLNYWGDETGPQHATANSSGAGDEVSDYVVFEPFYDNENLIGNLLLSTVSVPTAAYPNLNAALNAVADEGTILITGNFNQPAVTIDKRVTIIAETGVNPVITPLCSTPGALITVDYNTEVEITNLTFDFSGANENGAVIAMQGTEATISGCTFTGHAATGSGERALVITNGAEVAVQACTFSGFGSGTETATTATEAAIHIHNGGGNAPEVEIIPDNYFDNNYIGIHVGVDPATTDNSEVLINENVFGETICNAYAVKIEHGDAEVTAHENIFHCHTIYMVSAP
ncbi:right-handed parallel beta-helix repeat-containing protein, partial [Candidatus Saccharibacteria bacterium]|nr:right-handed parallel beta-helix repeat-containing protein [Candidatus Saccharibacteria bacterium]